KGMGLDSRIGPRFLQAGVGYGGSCFPKDVKALAKTLKEYECGSEILDAVDDVNEKQKRMIVPRIHEHFNGDLKGKKVVVWGLAFKPHTDDMREAPSVVIINELQRHGAKIHAFDPVAREEATKILDDVTYHDRPHDALKDADALVVVTEWDEFRHLDKKKMKDMMNTPIIFDGRNVYQPDEMKKHGFHYYSIGR
ncbi:UDP-glucose 6-dehydrogenase, partial [Candidatus Woesearchaeota archaeon CG08_land_8_20_14_0_20_43_7]